MDGDCSEAGSNFQLNECAVDGGVDRISPLPDEILYLILSYLPVRKAASTTVLSSRWLDLWKGIPNLKFNLESDRISRLPDKIILEILSFLTLKNVLATSVLSSRWSDLWKHNPCIDFYPHLWRLGLDDRLRRSLSRAECIEVVNSIVQSHKSLSLKLFRLRFCVKESDKCSVTRWLEFLFSREVERLVLNFECSDDPDMVILEESLRESGMYGAPQDLPFFKSIRRVWLGYLKVSGEDIKLFICNSPLLEYLSITSATFTSDVEVCGASDLVLDRLIFSGCNGGKSIKVSAPNLTLMEFCNNSSKLLVENVPRLAQASFESYDLDVVQQVANISQLQTLDVTIKYPMMAPWTNGFHQMPNLRKLFVRFSGRHGYSLLQIITLIWALPHLECFSLMNGGGDPLAPSVLSNGSTLIEAAASASMDGEGLDLPPKLKKVNRECCASRVVDGGVDRISQLPDEILILILSFLPLRGAVATSVLSSQWSDLWKHVPCLDFDPHDWGMDDRRRLNASESTEVVNSVIQSHNALSLKRFRVVSYIDRAATSVVTKWLEFVFSRRVESLGLDFLPRDGGRVFLEESLRETSITCGAPHTLPFCQSLKRLSLRSLIVGGHDVELFLSSCPLLEELTMKNAFLSSDINICGAKLSLKHFYIRSRGAVSIRVSAPNLSSLRFGSTEGKLVLEYVPQLLEANLKFLTSEFAVQHTALINRLPVLKLTVVSLYKMLSTDVFSHLPNLKKLWICCIFRAVNHSLLRVADLIWASPRLEEFKFKVTATPGYDFGALMEDITNVDRSPHQHLKVFKFKMCSQPTDQLVELATCISDNCIALRKMSIGSRVREQSHWDSIKQQVQGKVRSQIQLRFYSL